MEHIKVVNKGLENKIIELQQKLDEKVGSLGDSLLIYSKQDHRTATKLDEKVGSLGDSLLIYSKQDHRAATKAG